MQFILEYENTVDNICKSYIEAFQMDIGKFRRKQRQRKFHLRLIYTESLWRIQVRRIWIMKELVDYAFRGGVIVFGHTFACFVQNPEMGPLSSIFHLGWEAESYTRFIRMQCEQQHVGCTKCIPSEWDWYELSGVGTENFAYSGGLDPRIESPVVFTGVREGRVDYIDDVNVR